jgi:hypothetical protein
LNATKSEVKVMLQEPIYLSGVQRQCIYVVGVLNLKKICLQILMQMISQFGRSQIPLHDGIYYRL